MVFVDVVGFGIAIVLSDDGDGGGSNRVSSVESLGSHLDIGRWMISTMRRLDLTQRDSEMTAIAQKSMSLSSALPLQIETVPLV